MADRARFAVMFRALGDPTRLRIFQMLCSCRCPVSVEAGGGVRPAAGPSAGEVCCTITGSERITSTVSHHLKELRLAGLITLEKCGQRRICAVNTEALDALGSWVQGLTQTEYCVAERLTR
ncbi:MAG: helix-turn-helix transcriptional regulator [Armatimonadetes bacterium]|nr:helix-turn-helix transcriptional regulator [Armatimonadota bacterium]MDE2207948.1 helix-turn-helix transcriptional regulator [Armatimonadota bacterium]